MAGAAIAQRSTGHTVITAGTLAVDGMPMSWRTKAAIKSIGLRPPEHRSKQATSDLFSAADLIIGLAPEHVSWVRRNHSRAATRTASLIRLCNELPADNSPLSERLAAMKLADVNLGEWEEVTDPGGGEAADFVACAAQISALIDALLPLIGEEI